MEQVNCQRIQNKPKDNKERLKETMDNLMQVINTEVYVHLIFWKIKSAESRMCYLTSQKVITIWNLKTGSDFTMFEYDF